MVKVTAKTKLSALMDNEKAVETLFEAGMFCIGCPAAMQETVGEGCMAHGMEKKEVDEIIKKLNKAMEKKK